ncbi:MAG: hypothetical protein M0R28_23360 [Pigmentiphaga sp.]|nr:hypothetical protein [Pigmentiphaga sp.]
MSDESGVPADWITVEMEIDADVLAYCQRRGPDWEVRTNEALKRAIEVGLA